MTYVVKRSIPVLMILALLGVGVVSAQEEEIDTSDWVLHQGDETYLLAPADWIDLNNPEAINMAIEAAGSMSPELESLMATAGPQLEAGLMDIFLVEAVSTSTLNVIALDVGSEVPMAMLEPMMTAQYEQLGAESITVEQVEIPAGAALRAEYVLPLSDPSGFEYINTQIQYVVAEGTFLHILTLGTEQSVYKELLPTLEAIADSFGIGQAPAEGEIGTGQKPPAEVVEPATRDDVVRHDTPWISIIAPPDWFSARDGDAFAEFIAANGAHPQADPFFETLADDVAEGTYQYILVQPQDLAYMTLIAYELGADIPVSTFQDSQEATVKSDPDMEFIDGDIVTTPAGEMLRIEIVRPIRAGELHRELRLFWVANQNFVFMILAVPDALYADYEQVFTDIINTVSFPG